MPIRYFGTFNLTEKCQGWNYGKRIDFGNNQLFSGNYAIFDAFKEFKITYADIRISWTAYKTTDWKGSENPQNVAITCVSFIRDFDALDDSDVKTFDSVASCMGARTVHLTSGMIHTTRHRWVPTEPTDRDWRQTTNDGLCHIYMFWRGDDLTTTQHAANVTVQVTTNVQLRGLKISTSAVELTAQDHFAHSDPLHSTSIVSPRSPEIKSDLSPAPSDSSIEAISTRLCRLPQDS